MNILIVEDHPLIRTGLLLNILQIDPSASIVESESFPEALNLLDVMPFQMVILDIDVPGGENTKMINKIRDKQQSISILIYSGYDELTYAIPYLRAGADGFISKAAPQDELLIAVKSVMEKKKYIGHKIRELFLDNIDSEVIPADENSLDSLSSQELKVMHLIAEGKWTKQVASIMNLKASTVSTYKKRIFTKLGVNDVIELSKKISLLK